MAEPSTERREIEELFQKRLAGAESDIRRTWRHFCHGDPLMAETGVRRADAAVQRQQMSIHREPIHSPSTLANAEATKGERENFLPVSFLAMGTNVSRAVARVSVGSTGERGSGFLCAPGLLITNRHVLTSMHAAQSARVEFDFVEDDNIEPTVFTLDPARCFVWDTHLKHDYAVVAVGDRIDGSEDLEAFGWCPLSDADNKHAIGEFANIIQHPQGRAKQVVLQDNLIMSRGEDIPGEDHMLHYVADTKKGSSGSPVFNNAWQVIALHHWGVSTSAFHEERMYSPQSVNQGVRTSRIVGNLREKYPTLTGTERDLIQSLIQLGEKVLPRDVMSAMESQRGSDPRATNSPITPQSIAPEPRSNGSTWTIPLEITVNIPGAQRNAENQGEPSSLVESVTKREPRDEPVIPPGSESSTSRIGEGYRADFLDHNIVELPKIKASHKDLVVPLLKPERHPSAKHGELQFTHFSCVMRKDRKLPFFGACNVDGKRLFGINDEGQDYDYDDEDIWIFRPSIAPEAESSPGWKTDGRIRKSDQTGEKWYTRKNALVPREGTDDAEKYIPVADFDRGHIVRRTEPIWGPRSVGHEANVHTFTHVNSAPQTARFNRDQDRLPSDIEPGEEERSWYGMEVAILRAATDEDKKMCVFTGPIYEDTDPIYGPGKPGGGDRQVPMSFWKIAVWESGTDLRSLAMKYSQAWSVARAPDGAETLSEPSELYLLRDFLTTVADVEARTGILFGTKVRNADILKGLGEDALSKMTLDDFSSLSA